MPDEYLDGLDAEKRTHIWRELTQDADKIIFVMPKTRSVKSSGFLRWARPATPMPTRRRLRFLRSTCTRNNGEKESAARCSPLHSTKFKTASLTKSRCGYWKEIKEHALFTNRSDLPRTAPSRMTTTGKALPSARFDIVVTCKRPKGARCHG